jgi:hypothetical protein
MVTYLLTKYQNAIQTDTLSACIQIHECRHTWLSVLVENDCFHYSSSI